MPSATTADSSDSTPARKAIVKAEGSNSLNCDQWIDGRCGVGKLAAIPPKREPMVSTGRLNSATAIEAVSTAIKKPGNLGANLRNPTISASAIRVIANVAGSMLPRAPQNALHLATNSAGTWASDRPKKSLI